MKPDALDRNVELTGSAAEREMAETLFENLREATGDGVGITRLAYTPTETVALELIEATAKDHGLRTERDAGANLVVTIEGRNPELPFLACGSHMDSVPRGGNFDGAAGVVAGLLALVRFRQEGFVPERGVKLFALRGEESARFGRPYIGSKALFGQLSAADLASPASDTGEALADCMRSVGADIESISAGRPLLDAKSVHAWLELHIEQGPDLDARELPIGIVTAIRGNVRHRRVLCRGEAGHSGAVPRWLRHDAMFASAELITRLDDHWRAMLGDGADLVVTTGVFGTDPNDHAIARIPGTVAFSLDIRSQSSETLEAFYKLFLSECDAIAGTRGVTFEYDQRLNTAPARMDEDWIARLKAAARTLGLPDHEIASGGGHDSAVFANAGVPSAMIFVRNENGSHNPLEMMEIEDFLKGSAVLREAIRTAVQ